MNLPCSFLLRLTAAAVCCLKVGLSAFGLTPNDNALFLAGLPASDPLALESIQKATIQEHRSTFQKAWAEFDRRQTNPIQAWGKEYLPAARPAPRPLIYLFSGPDILHAHTFFPEAPVYVLCGIEPIGNIPQVDQMEASKIGPSLQQIRQSLDSVLSWSFFKTKNMKTDLTASPLQGTIPILYVFLARMGCHVDSINWVSIDRKGALVADKIPGTLAPGIKVQFTRAGQATPQTVYYFCSDLSDSTASKSGLLPWCASLGPADAFLKSASYLMHGEGFRLCRKFLIENSVRLLQDDSGIPLKHFGEDQWNLQPFGSFNEPIPLFKEYPQPELAALFAKNSQKALPFAFGYHWRPKQSGILLATKKPALSSDNGENEPGRHTAGLAKRPAANR